MGIVPSTIRGWYDSTSVANTHKLEDDVQKKASEDPTAVLTCSNEAKEGPLSARTPQITNYIAGESIEKELNGIAYEEFETVIERLSARYNISDDTKKRILDVKINESVHGEVRIEDDKYCIVVMKHEDKLDFSLSSAQIITYTADDYMR